MLSLQLGITLPATLTLPPSLQNMLSLTNSLTNIVIPSPRFLTKILPFCPTGELLGSFEESGFWNFLYCARITWHRIIWSRYPFFPWKLIWLYIIHQDHLRSQSTFRSLIILKIFKEVVQAFLYIESKTNILYVNINFTENLFFGFGR